MVYTIYKCLNLCFHSASFHIEKAAYANMISTSNVSGCNFRVMKLIFFSLVFFL